MSLVPESCVEENGKQIRSIDDSDSDNSLEQLCLDQSGRKKWTCGKKDPLPGAIRVLPGPIDQVKVTQNGNCHLVKPSQMVINPSPEQRMSKNVIQGKFKCENTSPKQVIKGHDGSINGHETPLESQFVHQRASKDQIPTPTSRRSILLKQQQESKNSFMSSASKSLTCINENSELKTNPLNFRNRAPSSIINPIWHEEEIYSVPNSLNSTKESSVNCANEKYAPKSIERSTSHYYEPPCVENGSKIVTQPKRQLYSDYLQSTEEIRFVDPRTGRSSLTKSTEEIFIGKWLQEGPKRASHEIKDQLFEETVEKKDKCNGSAARVSSCKENVPSEANDSRLKSSKSVNSGEKIGRKHVEGKQEVRSKQVPVKSGENLAKGYHSLDSPSNCSAKSDTLIGTFTDASPSIAQAKLSLSNIQLLTESNYSTWSKEMRSFLKSKGLLKFIESENESLKKLLQTVKGRSCNESTMAIICSKVDTKIYQEIIQSSTTAKELWLGLKAVQLNLHDLVQLEECKDDFIDDSVSRDLSHYDAEFYLLGRVNLKNEIEQLLCQIQALRDDLKKQGEVSQKGFPHCQFCGSKKHLPVKCQMFKDHVRNNPGTCTIC